MATKITDLFIRGQRKGATTRAAWIYYTLSLFLILFFAWLLAVGSLRGMEHVFLDQYFKNRPPLKTHSDIAIIEINEDSLRTIGPLPWPHQYYAQMINLLAEWDVGAIVFDVGFRSSNIPEEELALEDAITASKRVFLPVTLTPKKEKKIWVHSLPIILEPKGQGFEWNHSPPRLEKFSKGLGHVNVELNEDGVLRAVKPFLSDSSEVYPHLGLAVAYDHLAQELTPYANPFALDRKGNLIVNWAGKWEETFTHYNYADLIRSQQAIEKRLRPVILPEELQGKICLIGVSASRYGHVRVTPLQSNYPVLGVQANLLNSVLTNQFITPASTALNIFCLIFSGLLAAALFYRFKSVPALIIALLLGLLWIGLTFVVFLKAGVWICVFQPLLLMAALFIFSAIFNQIVVLSEQKRLFGLATRDGLTGLYNIRHFRDILNQVVKDALRTQEPLALILLDIDDFKPINDTHGHPAGDMVLRKTAEIVFSCLRSKRKIHEADFVGRYGGEEFIILLRKAVIQEVVEKVGERIRAAVEEAEFHWGDIKIRLTVSVGVSALHFNESVPDPMVHRADEALYRAKRAGKNRVCAEEPETPDPSFKNYHPKD